MWLVKIAVYSIIAALPFLVLISCSTNQSADMVLKGGKIYTVDMNFSIAQAVAISGDKIVYVGDDAGIEGLIGAQTKVIELNGKTVVPGLIDSHGHMRNLGELLETLDLTGTVSYSQIIDMVAEKVKTTPKGEWIIGHGWDQNDWESKEFPIHDELSNISPDNPVYLGRIDVHAALVNAKSMEIAGLNSNTPDPDGGKIHKMPNGDPTGVLIDNAMLLVSSKRPDYSPEHRQNILVNAAENCLKVGLTGAHDAGVPLETIEDYKKIIDEGRLGIRIYAMIQTTEKDLVSICKQNKLLNYGENYLSVRSLKFLIDGALGSRGAAMNYGYSDDPDNTGLLTEPYERILAAARAGLETGFQVITHAIGDRGNRLVLDAYETAMKENPQNDHRFRIEHSQIVDLEDIQRFKALNIIPSMQATHCTSDMYWVQDRIGQDRVIGSYAWRKFLDFGLHISNGSDFPIESNNPFWGIYASVTRQDHKGYPEGGWFPDQKMTREEALKSFTIWAAEAAFQEDILGSIEFGKLADLVVLSDDVMTVEPLDILEIKPLYTIVGGEIKYQTQWTDKER